MPQVIIVCVGLPGAGKTTWATKFVKENSGWVRVNKDALRAMFYGNVEGRWNLELEDFVVTVRDHSIHMGLARGYNIVVDDTNLASKHIIAINAFAETHGCTVELEDFTDVPLQDCLDHNKARADKKPLKDEVILGMHRAHFEDGRWKHLDAFRDMIRAH